MIYDSSCRYYTAACDKIKWIQIGMKAPLYRITFPNTSSHKLYWVGLIKGRNVIHKIVAMERHSPLLTPIYPWHY
jgi:hypothetical protein